MPDPCSTNPTLWFDDQMRQVIAEAAARTIHRHGYTFYAFAACRNHIHALPRTHRDRAEIIWQNLADATRHALRAAGLVPAEHPIWSLRPYKVFKYLPPEVLDCIDYINDNPEKEGLPQQHWTFVTPCRF